jgi:hypothetical protein
MKTRKEIMTLVLAGILTLLFTVAVGMALKGGSLTFVFWWWIAAAVLGFLSAAFYIQAYVILPKEQAQESAQRHAARPTITVKDVTLVRLSAGETVGVHVMLGNSGQSLARNVTTLAAVWSAPITGAGASCPDIPSRPDPLPSQSRGDVGIQHGITIPVYGGQPLSPGQVSAISAGSHALYVYAIAEYRGLTDDRYATEVYGRYDVNSHAFVKCDRHNEAS